MTTPLRLGPEAIVRVMRDQGDKCYYCRRTFSDTVLPSLDHKIPSAHGGKTTAQNLVLACKKCNESKGCLPIDDFLNGFIQFNYRDKIDEKWYSEQKLVRGPRKWYHGDVFHW